uniref:Metalloendopeptidase n=1 Tax=Panagrolaimus superbus TaxID=310955 RepID=A0A914XTJ4_9BILA
MASLKMPFHLPQDLNGKLEMPMVIIKFHILLLDHLVKREEYRMIISAMVRIQANTCIRFIRRTNERDFINIESVDGEGCFAYVGNHGGRSSMNLESSGKASCMFHDIVIHELLHSVGLWHEHMRHDRDKYIKVHYENIARGKTYEGIYEIRQK